MGDPNPNPNPNNPHLPPGFRFHPSDQQLICFYLTNKNNIQNPNPSFPSSAQNPLFLSFDVIREIDLYNSDPYDLPDTASFPFGHGGTRKHWYCFALRLGKGGLSRKAKGGIWKRKGPIRTVMGGADGQVIGIKARFVFYRRDSALRGFCKTNWAMIEYALVDHQKDSFVLCRVFLKPCNGTKTLEVVRNSYAEGKIAPKQTCSTNLPSIKHEGASASDLAEVLREDSLVHLNDRVARFPVNSNAEPEDKVVKRPVSDGVGSFWGIDNLIEPVNSSSWLSGGKVTLEDFMSDELRVNSTILEGDFLELNDLLRPLVCPYSSG